MINLDKVRFLTDIEGWLLPEAVQLTLGLLQFQDSRSWTGSVLEIGVWRGKYISLLHHATVGNVYGFDIFEHGNTQEEVYATFERLFGKHHRLKLSLTDSTRLTTDSIKTAVRGETMRWISVDGSHEADPVCHDLVLADAVLADHGVVAIDDFLNSRAIGVSEGAYRYFFDKGKDRLRPFAFAGNKLYACRPDKYEDYHSATRDFIDANPKLPMSQEFQEMRKNGEHWVDYKLLGTRCLVLT